MSLYPTMKMLTHGLPSALIDASAIEQSLDIAARLPETAAAFGFECRLNERGVDFLVCVEAHAHPLRALAAVDEFHRRLTHACSPAVNDMWLEYDLVSHGGFTPSVFYHFRDASAGVVENVSTLLGTPLDRETRDTLARCFAALPANAVVDQAGFMLSRSHRALRLVVRLPWAQVSRWLDAVDWDGPADALRSHIDRLSALSDYAVVDVELRPRVSADIGLECHFNRRRQPPSEPRWRRLLDHLVDCGAATSDRRDALLDVPRRISSTAGQEDYLLILSHIKVSIAQTFAAKAYFGYLRAAPAS